jgi:uncharacterized membrane protein YecN with MAPEG domain
MNNMPVPVTLLYGALNALLTTLLGSAVSLRRLKTRVFVGDAPTGTMLRMVRAHGNNAEWAPLGILLLLLLELSHAPSLPLHLFGGLLLFTRAVHALGMVGRLRTGVPNSFLHYGLFATMSLYALWLRFAG